MKEYVRVYWFVATRSSDVDSCTRYRAFAAALKAQEEINREHPEYEWKIYKVIEEREIFELSPQQEGGSIYVWEDA